MAYDIVDPVFHSYEFEIEIIDPCLNDAILTPAPQVDPPNYYYTGNNPATQFNLAPFGIEPENFCTISLSCGFTVDPLKPTLDLCTINETLPYTTKGEFDELTGTYTFESNDQTMSEVPPGDYIFDITAVVGSTTEFVQFTLKIVDPCLDQV